MTPISFNQCYCFLKTAGLSRDSLGLNTRPKSLKPMYCLSLNLDSHKAAARSFVLFLLQLVYW